MRSPYGLPCGTVYPALRLYSSGNDTLLCCTTATFTSAGIPLVGKGNSAARSVETLPVPPYRHTSAFPLETAALLFVGCLFIGSQLSPSLPSHGRSPFHSWLQIVVSSFSWLGISTGDLNPIYNVPMLGTHKAWDTTPFAQGVCF